MAKVQTKAHHFEIKYETSFIFSFSQLSLKFHNAAISYRNLGGIFPELTFSHLLSAVFYIYVVGWLGQMHSSFLFISDRDTLNFK